MEKLNTEASNYPGGSKKRVTNAGNRFRNNNPSEEDLQVFEEWRSAHRAVLNTFQAILRIRTKGQQITVAQRHKRKSTILNKLKRFPEMQLARMDDIAGCRLIFQNINDLYLFRENFHKARVNHVLKNEINKYDYIKNPKNTGYRGIHDIYEYNVKSIQGKSLKGLNIEIQYRTLIQHSWATAVELIGFITESQPKFQVGDTRYERVMMLASEILSRAHENMKGPMPEITNSELIDTFKKEEAEIALIRTLRGVEATPLLTNTKKRNAILIFDTSGNLSIKTFETATEALKELFKLENELKNKDIVLVRADTNDEIRLAYKNYFSDAKDFLKLLDEGCNKLKSTT